MDERKIIKFKKDEFAVKEYTQKSIGKGKASKVKIEYTPVGEKIIVSTHKPGFVIGKGGEKIAELTRVLKDQFKLENPHIEIEEVTIPEFNAKIIADEVALSLEKFGPIKFKIIAYKMLDKIMKAGALGAEIRLSGKLPGARAKSWRFSQGYLKKTGESANVVDRAQARAETIPGTVGIKVSILPPNVVLKDRINLNQEMIKKLKENEHNLEKAKTEKKSKSRKAKTEEIKV